MISFGLSDRRSLSCTCYDKKAVNWKMKQMTRDIVSEVSLT